MQRAAWAAKPEAPEAQARTLFVLKESSVTGDPDIRVLGYRKVAFSPKPETLRLQLGHRKRKSTNGLCLEEQSSRVFVRAFDRTPTTLNGRDCLPNIRGVRFQTLSPKPSLGAWIQDRTRQLSQLFLVAKKDRNTPNDQLRTFEVLEPSEHRISLPQGLKPQSKHQVPS